MAIETAYQEYMSGWRKEWYQKNRVEVLAKKKKKYAAMKSAAKAKARQKAYQKAYREAKREEAKENARSLSC